MSDLLTVLPTDDYPVAPEDAKTLDRIIQKDSTAIYLLLQDCTTILVIGIVFVIMQTDIVRNSLESWIPYASSSPTSLLVVRTTIFMIILFVIRTSSQWFEHRKRE